MHYLPIATTLVSLAFLAVLIARAARRGWPPHLVWWGVGVFFYGLGTAVESAITLAGNGPILNRVWYWAGAILGGYPLATGSVYLLLPRRTAHALTAVTLLLVIVASAAVLLSPIDPTKLDAHRPGGAALGWQWVRALTPIINLYAAAFLVGGALHSSVNFFLSGTNRARAIGTALIAAGGILPGVGGGMAKAGMVEALYVGEFLGLLLIWAGYSACVKAPAPVTLNSPAR
ncbi:MAG TPA: hypothetical protein DEB06_08905 [Phycisphaerales bacterium]|nr:hypothetical protein [Phycisphaerales bacterium]